MKETLILKNPIKVEDEEVKVLEYDFDLYGMSEHERANSLRSKQNRGSSESVQEIDYTYHLIIGRIIIDKTMAPRVTYEDLSRLKGADIFQVQRIGRDFLLGSAELPAEN